MGPELHTIHGHRAVETLAAKLRRRQVVGSREAALETVLVLRQVVSKARFSNIQQLIAVIRGVGRRLVEAQPKEHTVGNTVRRILHNIREEASSATKVSAAAPARNVYTISKFVLQGQPRKHNAGVPKSEATATLTEDDPNDPDSFARGLKPVLMEAIQDVLDELETVYDNVSKNAKDHIHSDEIILTIGHSKTVEAFLKSAAHYRNYTVIVAETAPSYSGHDMARSLSSAGISTFLVPDSSIFAIMSRVNKVILGAHAILANGGLVAVAGSLLAATAAQAHSTPVVVCAGQFKLTPLWNLYHDYGALDLGDPSSVLGFEEGKLVERVDVVNPYYDYVSPELVDVFITNDGDHPPSSVYRLIKETYDDDDNEL
ncbi:eukaryotic translation initiation factor 2B beta subunit [Polyporus arcularius HHB13444]|uniref:Translation initiation factor eIF2B subunit beta n=2 Tax=Polyporaceae TaxID=5317 RepID=A0A5C3PUA7_9APHY|nr:eukaryotic translation initiation factor 2B beta subunit [Polyporus brumalis]TFK93132.1 eukaryotic translation initiation factor 2B beta subunit [Polyporus arcularius HHB13444]